MSIKEPFQNENDLIDWVKADTGYQKAYQNHKDQIVKQLNFNRKTSIYMKINQKTTDFFKYLSTHVAIAISLGIILSLSVSAAAAELIAPTELKPSSLISNLFQKTQNTQNDSDPFTKLKADDNNDVINMEECGLSVKYPKKVDNYTIQPSFIKSQQVLGILEALSIEAQEGNELIKEISIFCSDSLIEPKLTDKQEKKSLTKKELQDFTGWFVTEGEIDTITDIASSENRNHLVNFNYKNRFYSISFTEQDQNNQITDGSDKKYSGVFANQIQIQLSDLVTSQSSFKPETIELNKPAETSLESNKPVIQTATQNVSLFEDCSLAVQYKASSLLLADVTPRYKTTSESTLDTKTLEFITLQELGNNNDTPTLTLECADKPFELLENAEVFETKENPNGFLAFTGETKDQVSVSRLSRVDYGFTFNNDKPQTNTKIISEFKLENRYFRQIKTIFIDDTLTVNPNKYPFNLNIRPQTKILFQSTTLVPRPSPDSLTQIERSLLPEVTLRPKNEAKLFKQIIPSDDDCSTLSGKVVYQTAPLGIDNRSSNMSLLRRNMLTTNVHKQNLKTFDDLMNKKIDVLGDKVFMNIIDCMGFGSIYLYDIDADYQGSDKVRAILYEKFEGGSTGHSVYVYATKNDYIIQLVKALPFEGMDAELPYLESCGATKIEIETRNYGYEVRDCARDKVNKSPELREKANKLVQELLTNYALR